MLKRLLLFSLLCLVYFSSCDKRATQAENDQLLKTFQMADDTAEMAFDTMLKVETRKWFMVKRLADELEFTRMVDTLSIFQLRTKLEEVRAIPYSPASIAEEGLIDRYDAKTEEIIQLIPNIFNQTADWEKYPILLELRDEVKTLDDRVIFMRGDYDRAAFRYNDLLQEMRNKNDEAFKSAIAKGKRAVFQLGPPS